MRRLGLALILATMLGGCASSPPIGSYYGNPWMSPNGVPMDPTYPGPGARIGVGVGVGSWGGGSGAGIGFGLGF